MTTTRQTVASGSVFAGLICSGKLRDRPLFPGVQMLKSSEGSKQLYGRLARTA